MADEMYNRKLESLQQYIPFLDNMIAQLKDPSKKNREQQLNKMQSLHAMITDKRKKLKLETLIKCEDVISKLYEKVHNKPIGPRKMADNFMSTPASPSPPRDIIAAAPLTIPTERLEDNRIRKIDIYSSAGESLNRQRMQQSMALGTKVPDMSKPPISLEDLKTLEEDVQEKINEVSLTKASLYELNSLREKLAEQIQMEDVLAKSPSKNSKDDLESINTTVRNNLNLTKKVIQPPDKSKSKDMAKLSPNKPLESSSSTLSPKKELKNPTPPANKSPKILKEPASIFGSILSHIDDQILECKKKKEERRSSITGKDEKKSDKESKKKERRHSILKDDANEDKKDKDVKKKERSSSSTEEKSTTKEEKKLKGNKEVDSKKKDHQSPDKNKPKVEKKEGDNKEENKKEDKHKHSTDKTKATSVSLSGKISFELEEERLKKELESKIKEANVPKENTAVVVSEDKNKDVVAKIFVKKDLAVMKTVTVDFMEEESNKQTTFKRLADKYNPKPKKPVVEQDVDKEVSDIIEENMKTSPPKPPLINQLPAPIPPPASLLLCSQMEPEKPEPVPAPLPTVLQNILNPSTTELINTVVSQLRQNNAENESRNIPPMRTPSVENFVSDYTRDDNFVSEYTKEDFSRDDFAPNNIHISDFNNFQPQPQPQLPPPQQLRRERLNFEPPSPFLNNQFNQMNHQNQRFMSPLMGEGYNDNFSPNRPFTPMPQTFPQNYNNFQPNQTAPTDIQPLDYYPPNAPIPPNQYSCGPPLLSPEVPHFINEQKPSNFGIMPNHDAFGHNEDMRWRQEDTRFQWDRRDQDHRVNRDPRTYREYREMRESRDPRVMNRESRDNRDQRENTRTVRDPRVNRDLRDNREPRERDPRLNKDRDSRDFDRDRPRFRDGRSQNRDTRPSRYDTKFDRMYSRTNRDRSRSRSRTYTKDTFTSPLDSLYSGKEEHKTGKGYGVQNFRIPKIKKEDEEKEQSTKVSSTNEEVNDVVQSINEDSNDSINNEVTGNDVDTELDENAERIKEVTKFTTNEEAGKADAPENEINDKETEIDKTNQEPPKLQNETEEMKAIDDSKPTIVTQPVEQEQAKPADQTILAQFFANLLGSQNKKEKKTALYSLISTFSDSFSEKELSKITKIIKADEDADSSEDDEEVKKPEPKPDTDASKEPEKEVEMEETHPEDSPVKMPKRKTRRRIRRISSTASVKDEKDKEEEVVKTPEPPEIPNAEEESVVVSVGERIKSRKRTSVTPPKPKKRCKTELDMLHEDIQDMFIRDGVLTASGKRMCRILKSDPNALTTPQTAAPTDPPKIRKKPGPKPKSKLNQLEMKTMKNISVIIPKMPDSSFEPKENPRRSLRNSTRAVYTETDEDENSVVTEGDSVLGEGSLKEDDSDAESTDTEKDKTSQATDNATKTKATKRKRGKGWASGNIPSSKKKKKKLLSAEESTEKDGSKSPSATQSDSDKSFIVPDKNYYIDFVTNKSHECRLCDYHGRFITTHYKSQHPESEILTSRFSPAVAQEAIEDSNKNLDKYDSMMKMCGSTKFHYTCRFCAFNTSVPPTIFYDHITTHTGEYRHICPMCDFSAASGKTLKSHMSNIHNNIEKRVARKSYSQSIVFGYMCGECNYVQLTQKNVEDHINIFHLQKPNIYKVNMSTTVDPEMANLSEKEPKKDAASPKTVVEEKSEEPPTKEKKNKVDKSMLPPQPRKYPKAAPKSVKEKLKAKKALAEKDGNVSDTSSIAESESSCSTEPEKIDTPEPIKPKPVPKRRLTREVSISSEEDIVLSGRSRRAAKDKAAEKLKTLMELSENGGRKKSISATGDDNKNKSKEVSESEMNNEQTENKEEQKDKAAKPEEGPLPEKKEIKSKIKKEIELNVFTCKTDIQEENKKIEQERLQLMDELNKSVGNRTSLNFVDKLCNRLSNNDIIVKQEPRDDLTDSLFPSEAPLTMPVLEKNLPTHSSEPVPTKTLITPPPPPKKPVLETEDMQVSNPSFDVTQKNNKLITDMIQKLKGKMANISDDKSESSITAEDVDYDSEGPPPLTHVNKLPNVKPANGSIKTMLMGGFMRVTKYSNHLMFSCLVPPCLFSTEDKEVFQKHCSEAHKLPQEEKMTLCDMCGMEMVSTEGSSFLESIFKHVLQEHADFMHLESKLEETTDIKPVNRQLRLRKLSGDALSVIKSDWEEEIDKTTVPTEKAEENNKENQDVAPVSETAIKDTETVEEPAVSTAELEVSDENPFPFKIAGVMSLAEPLPPLAPIAKPTMQAATQLIVKEAKLSQFEVSRPRKTPKAMAKFIASVSDLYKCPHYYCLFSTNFRDFLEKHLKAHKVEHDVMIPCVYCDMKTPWEHVPMHIDIRHAHCRFACSYCLYRAVLREYVFLHQDQMHPENDYSIIALPQPKHSKKWAIADVKVHPKSLCEPYRCTPLCNVEFLFENEFRKHLQDVHKSNFISCGHKNCGHRVQANKMSAHWSLNHNISIYQCGYCKMNGNEIKMLYKHFALFHQGMTPDILVRRCKLPEGANFGYAPEAFSALRKIITIPNNISGENKGDAFTIEPSTVPVILPNNTVPYGVPTKATLQVVTSLSQNMPKSVSIPSSKSVINRAITLVTSNSSTSSANILLLPSATSGSTLSGIVVSPQSNKQITSVAAISKTLKVVPSGHNVIMAVPVSQEISAQKDNEDSATGKDNTEVALTIEPLEHITLGEDNSQSNEEVEETDPCEADPLSLEADTDMNDASKSADSSGDESDKLDKSKKEAKSGLMSYQLYRCAFCDISFSNSVDFKRHATFSLNCRIESQVVKPFLCVHCGKQLKNPHVLVEHVQCHGVLRFTCSLCGSKFPTVAQTRTHIKNRHNITHTSLTPMNPAKQNLELDEFVVRPKLMLHMGAAKDAAPAEPSASAAASETVYTPDTIDQIPMRHILSSSVKCGLCSYTTKVRTNMVRHLQFHSEEKAVSDTAPVNPVPCLEKNEKMFDKMVNLASSSHSSSRMGGAKPDGKEKETESHPEFVPSHCRYVCCAHGCSYICPEEGNLRHHLIALHDSDISFTCVHCKSDLTPTDADSLMKHFKLHGLQLYKCPYCSFVHNLRHKVEKHVSDKHLDVPVKITVVRCMESEPKDNAQEPSTSTAQSTPVPPPTTKYYKPWRCCMCKYKSGTQEGIEAHVLEKHEVDSHLKCALCTYKTNDKETFADHFKTTHDNQIVDIIYAYRKLEDDKEKESEAFDTTPLWQRDRPRVRHIRGILFDDSSPVPTKSPKKVKSASATPTPGPSGVRTTAPSPGPSGPKASTPTPGPSGVKSTASSSGPSATTGSSNLDMSIESVVNGTADILQSRSTVSDDFFTTVNKLIRDSNDDIAKVRDSMVIVIEDEDEPKVPVAKDKDNKNAPVAKNRVVKRKGAEAAGAVSKIAKISDDIIDLESSGSEEEQDEFSERNLKLRYGGFGMPLWRQFKCPVCNMFKSKRISDFVFHLFKEMKVFRFKCKLCPDESITYRYMHKHVNDHHRGSDYKENIVPLPIDEMLLTWLQMVIREQSVIIVQNYPKFPQAVIGDSPQLVQCEFCSSKFHHEQEKNEHGVSHWTAKPYNCSSCTYTSYVQKDILKHFKSTHEKEASKSTEDQMVVANGFTVEKLLKISDDQHEREALARMPQVDVPMLATISTEPTEIQDPLGDIAVEEPAKDPLEIPASSETEGKEEEEAALSDNDLIIVTKTDSADVPTEGDVFCCEYCAFMANSEVQVISHISGLHEHMHINFKKLNRATCENPKEYVGCSLCSAVGSEVRIRQHHLEKHTGFPMQLYRYKCALCPRTKKFLKFMGLKVHFNRLHPNVKMQYTSIFDGNNSSGATKSTGLKTYRCPICPYVRNFKANAVNNIRQHVKQHFKAFTCGLCHNLKYKTRGEVLVHYTKEHPGDTEPFVEQDQQLVDKYNTTMAGIIAAATEVREPVKRNTARKSTSAPHASSDAPQEYSYYGGQQEEVDLSKIMTSVEVNGMHLSMTAERLSKIFDLDVAVALEDCNLSVNLSSVFDS